MKNLTSKEVQNILLQEIGWCVQNRNEHLSDDYYDGFMAGLTQAKFILLAANDAINEDYNEPFDCAVEGF